MTYSVMHTNAKTKYTISIYVPLGLPAAASAGRTCDIPSLHFGAASAWYMRWVEGLAGTAGISAVDAGKVAAGTLLGVGGAAVEASLAIGGSAVEVLSGVQAAVEALPAVRGLVGRWDTPAA